MTPLRIAFLSRWYWEENRRWATVEGGPTQQLAEAVAALGHEVIVLSQSPKVEELRRSQIGTLEVWLSPREKRRDFFTSVRDKWAKRTKAWAKKGDVFVYFISGAKVRNPATAQALIERL